MSNLSANINSSDQLWTLTAGIADSTRYVKVGTEVCEVLARFPSSVYTPTGEVIPPKIRVTRGAGGTTPASHLSGAALTEYEDESAFAGAGGATPDLAAVLAEGNDPGGTAIEAAAGDVGVAGGSVDIEGGIGNAQDNSGASMSINGGEADGAGGGVGMYAGKGGPGVAGGSASISGGAGDDENDNGASLTIGGGDGAGTDGAITATGSAFTFNGQPLAAGLQSVTIDLDAADIATLNSVPVEVVSAPGANKVIIPLIASFQYKAGAVAYEVAIPSLRQGTSNVVTYSDAVLSATDSTLSSTFIQGFGHPQVDVANAALVITADVDPESAGDGTARLTVLYYVMDLLP